LGRRPLKDDYVQKLVLVARQVGIEGLTRKTALELGAVSEARWTLIKNKAVREGRLIRVGWKKSARYFAPGFEPQEDPSEPRIGLAEEEELEDVIELLDETPIVELTQPNVVASKHDNDIDIEWDFDFSEEE
jgi:hypothetical protein